MSEVSKKGFPYPLQIGSLEAFCHPDERQGMARPFWDGDKQTGEAVATCGYLSLRVRSGLFSMEDFEKLPERVRVRLDRLPWSSFPWAIKDEGNWRDLADAKLFRFGSMAAWLNDCPAPQRVVRVADAHLVRLGFLQLAARLPAAQVYMGVSEMLLFRFTGGIGIALKDTRLTEAGFSVLTPARWDDGAIRGRTVAKELAAGERPAGKFKGWPPAEEVEEWPPVEE